MNVTVVGTGYVGLVAGACLAHVGHRVTCVDNNSAKIDALNVGKVPIFEPGLDAIVADSFAAGRLTFTTDLATAVASSAVVFIAVGTPSDEDGSADVSSVLAVARDLAPSLSAYTVVVCKSTVPIGTCDAVKEAVASHAPGDAEWDVVSNPEFLREGVAIDDFLSPDRVVVGSQSERARTVMAALYAPVLGEGAPLLLMGVRSAEMTKYAANCMLATRISFINEIAGMCDRLDVDVRDVKTGIGADSRIGPAFLNAGIGYGGSCFPKDVKALLSLGHDAGCQVRLLEVVEAINYDQKGLLARRVFARLGDDLSGRRIALLGLAFKPHTDDMRQAPSIRLCKMLLAAGATVAGYDPVAHHTARRVIGDAVHYADSWQEAVAGADAILLVTEWPELCAISPAALAEATACRWLLDGRNSWDPAAMQAAGFEYHGVGRQPVSQPEPVPSR